MKVANVDVVDVVKLAGNEVFAETFGGLAGQDKADAGICEGQEAKMKEGGGDRR